MPESASKGKAMSREIDRQNRFLRRFYSMGEVEAITSLSRATIYRKMAEGTFPSLCADLQRPCRLAKECSR